MALREQPVMEAHVPLIARAAALIPPDLHASAWVAGSAANHSLRAAAWAAGGDLDVFVVGLSAERRADVGASIRSAATSWRDMTSTMEGLDVYPAGGLFDVVYAQDRLQVMLTSDSIEATLARFDISCHGWAHPLLAPRTNILHAPFATRFGVDVIGWTRPQHTAWRAMKMTMRYLGYQGLHELWQSRRFLECVREASGMELVDGATVRLVKSLVVVEGL